MRAAQRGSASESRRSFACTGPGRTARPFSSSTTPPPPRTSRRSRFSPPSATSTTSTGAARSGRGCTGSSSTVRSTGRGRGSCAPRASCGHRCRAGANPAARRAHCSPHSRQLPPEHRAVIVLRHLLEYTPGEIAELLGLPRGTVNSRLRRGLDSLKERCEERPRADRDPGGARGARAFVGGRARCVRGATSRSHNAARGSRSRLSRLAARRRRRPAEPARAGRCSTRFARSSGSRRAQPALFSLPAPGRLLVTADSGAWVVEQDGSKRLLGAYREASWSPFGDSSSRRARTSSSRRRRRARCAGRSPGRTSASRAGAARGRTRGSRTSRATSCGWSAATARATECSTARPCCRAALEAGTGHRLAYARRDGSVRVVDVDTGSGPGSRRADCARASELPPRSELRTIGAGDVAEPVLSPDGRWLGGRLARGRPVRLRPRQRRPAEIQAVSNVSSQFRSRSFPTISGWCCAP